jgi:hypothetical protein
MQVLEESCVNVTRQIAFPLAKDSARLVVDTYATWCTETTPAEISAAFRIEDESRIAFRDTLSFPPPKAEPPASSLITVSLSTTNDGPSLTVPASHLACAVQYGLLGGTL